MSAHPKVYQFLIISSELLLKSDWSIINIAEKVGYNDVSSFIRRFRHYFGTTPLQYRIQKSKIGCYSRSNT